MPCVCVCWPVVTEPQKKNSNEHHRMSWFSPKCNFLTVCPFFVCRWLCSGSSATQRSNSRDSWQNNRMLTTWTTIFPSNRIALLFFARVVSARTRVCWCVYPLWSSPFIISLNVTRTEIIFLFLVCEIFLRFAFSLSSTFCNNFFWCGWLFCVFFVRLFRFPCVIRYDDCKRLKTVGDCDQKMGAWGEAKSAFDARENKNKGI